MPYSLPSFGTKGAVKRRYLKQYHGKKRLSRTRKITEEMPYEKDDSKIEKKMTANPNICRMCEKSFSSAENLKLHLSFHRSKKPFTCEMCNRSFSYKVSLNKHQCARSKNKLHSTASSFNKEQSGFALTDGEENTMTCSLCAASFCTDGELKEHMKEHPDEMPDNCAGCDASFHVNEELTGHSQGREAAMREVLVKEERLDLGDSENITWNCSVCELRFSHENELVSHMRTHTEAREEQTGQTLQCNATFFAGLELRKQMVDNSKHKTFKCPFCELWFSKEDQLQFHIRLHTGENLESLKEMEARSSVCPVCRKSYSSAEDLNFHMRIHRSSEKPCAWGSSDNENVSQNHLNVHPKEKLHSPPEYGESFGMKAEFHIRIHSGEKLLQCFECPAMFTEQNDRLLHMREHMVSKNPFECFVCWETFVRRDDLKHHMDMHFQMSDVNHLECPECTAYFLDKTDLMLHMSVHTGVFQCSVCSAGFASCALLQAHLSTCSVGAVPNEPAEGNSDELGVASFFAEVELQDNRAADLGGQSYQCSVCRESLDFASELEKHLLGEHPDETIHRCSLCIKTFKFRTSLLYHVRTHACEEPVSCAVCCKRFQGLKKLKRHMQTHAGEESDDLEYASEGDHPKIHNRAKPAKQHQCTVCKRYFARKRNVVRHMAIHKKERRFPCARCGMSFDTDFAFELHLKSHDNDVATLHGCPENSAISHRSSRARTGETISKCSVCGVFFGSIHHLEVHMLKHTVENRSNSAESEFFFASPPRMPYICASCGARFCAKDDLSRHCMQEHSNKKSHKCSLYKCTECGSLFTTDEELRNHLQAHIDEMQCKCSICNALLPSGTELTKHMYEHSDNSSLKCSFCEVGFAQSVDLEIHLRKHMAENPYEYGGGRETSSQSSHQTKRQYVCVVCQMSYSSQENLMSHMTVHTSLRRQNPTLEIPFSHMGTDAVEQAKVELYKCSVCDLSYIRKKELQSHVRSHTKEKSHTCRVCSDSFRTRDDLRTHVKTHNQTLKCDVCEKSFRVKKKLTQHMKREHARKVPKLSSTHTQSVNCTVCKRSFRYEKTLMLHMKTHEKPVPQSPSTHTESVKCTVCEKSFRHKKYLIAHMKIHPKSAPKLPSTHAESVKCALCEKSFRNKTYLTRHMKTHSQNSPLPHAEHVATQHSVQPLRCCVCARKFTTESRLRIHVRLHAGVKLYSCSMCGKSFNGSKQLEMHVLSKHQVEKTHRCSVCDKRFTFLSSLARHVETHASEKPQHSENEESQRQHSENEEPQSQCKENRESQSQHQENGGSQSHHLENGESQSQHQENGESQSHHQENGESQSQHQGNGESQSQHQENGDSWYQCFVCKQGFGQKEDLDLHTCASHLDGMLYKCTLCSKCFSESEQLKVHLSEHIKRKLRKETRKPSSLRCNRKRHGVSIEPVNSFSCATCNVTFDRDASLQIHMITHAKIKPHDSCYLCKERICPVCKERFLSGRAMRHHSRLHVGGREVDLSSEEQFLLEMPHECSVCERRFARRKHLRVHVRSHSSSKRLSKGRTGVRRHQCPLCERIFRSSGNLNEHITRHATSRRLTQEYHLAKQYQCTLCDKRFMLQKSLKHHMQSHTDPLRCSVCNKSLFNEFSLKQHMMIHTDERPFPCPVCEFRFRQKSALQKHMTCQHPGEAPLPGRAVQRQPRVPREPNIQKKQHKCADCVLKFPTEEELQTHLESSNHTAKKRRKKGTLKCPECDATFISSEKLEQHKKKHGIVRQYKCAECDETFKLRAALVQHQLQHAAEDKPFQCNTCGANFKTKGNLGTHMRVHSRERSFKCPNCTACYAYNQDLQKHLSVHDSKDAVTCPECGACCKNAGLLKVHMHRHRQSP